MKETRASSKHVILIIFILSLILQCKDDKYCSLEETNKDKAGKSSVAMLTRTSTGLSILLETDSNGDGVKNDYLWIKGDKDNKENLLLLFNEINDEKKMIVEQIWYGPGNRKLVGKLDLNKDGKLETTVYYNFNAVPKNTMNTVARFEIDVNSDSKTDIWIYPNLRLELDKTGDTIPDVFTENQNEIDLIYNSLIKEMKLPKENLKTLNATESYALHPERIKQEINKSVIPFGI